MILRRWLAPPGSPVTLARSCAAGAIRLQDGFTLDVAGTMLDLQSSVPERLGPDGAPATGFRIDFGDRFLELVRAEPRSSLLIDTKPWPTRARRIAELMVLAAPPPNSRARTRTGCL